MTGTPWDVGGNSFIGTAAPQQLGTITAGFDLDIIAGNTSRIYVNATTGNVGIGTSSPGTDRLNVNGHVAFSGQFRPAGQPGNATDILTSGGTLGAPTWQPQSTLILAHAWGLMGNSGTTAGTNYVGTSDSVDLVVKTNAVERMRILASGNVGIGTSAPGPDRLYVNGSVTVSGSLTVLSDARLKENVVPLDGALRKVLALRGVSYDFRPHTDLNLPASHQIGFIAQELEQVVPEAVTTTSGGYKGVSYYSVVPLLVESTREQQVIIEELSARLSRLEEWLGVAPKPALPGTADGSTEADRVEVGQNIPNPFGRETTIPYGLPEAVASAELVVFEAGSGREVERFVLTQRGAGEVRFGTEGLANGSYVYGIIADGRLAGTRTMMVAR